MISELFGLSQPSVSRTIAFLRPFIIQACRPEVEHRRDSVRGKGVSLLDGTLIPTWNWRSEQGLYSGKHHRHGMNLQVATDEQGLLFTVGQPLPGSVHDTKAFRLSGIEKQLTTIIWADLGYYGTRAVTPIKKPQYRPLTTVEKNINRDHSRYRWPIEQTISHLKNWKILSTRYRGPLHQLHHYTQTILALEIYKTTW